MEEPILDTILMVGLTAQGLLMIGLTVGHLMVGHLTIDPVQGLPIEIHAGDPAQMN